MIEPLRNWADRYRSRGKYTPVGVAFHWIMAAMIITQLLSGWYMQRLTVGADKLSAYAFHSQLGLAVLLLGGGRLVWRLMVPGPINDADAPGAASTIAHMIHAVFYALFVVLPLSGWALWSAVQPSQQLYLLGFIPIPNMPFQDFSPEMAEWAMGIAMNIHVACVVVLTLLVPAHALAAIKHHFWDRDDVLEGMLPEVPDTHSHPGGPRYSPPAPAIPRPPKAG